MTSGHSAILIVALLALAAVVSAQQPFQVMSTVDATEIAGRPVQLDAGGKLLPWPFPDNVGYSYSSHVLSQWTILWDQFQRQRLPYFYCCFAIDQKTGEMVPDHSWANSTAYTRAMLEGFVERLYPYTGDRRTLAFLEDYIDYEIENGLTPDGYAWSRVPYPSADPGVAKYKGWSPHGTDYVEPHLIGEDGYAYLRLYEMTGKTRYRDLALHFADALVKNYKPGDEEHSPWPVRCFAKDGRVEGKGMGPYSANVLGPISLFDELIRLKLGDTAKYARVRKAAWEWLERYPLRNNVWVGYFEDVAPSMGNMNNVIPLETARYVLLHPEKDPKWRDHARQLIDWVKTTPKWPKYRVHGATVTTEQGNGINFCCNEPNQCCDSHTSRLAAVEALYYARTGDENYREEAFRSFNWVTYFQGLPDKAHAPFSEQWWFTDEFTDGPRRLMDAFWAVPEWAPADESHLLGSSSVVANISYGQGSVRYSTFDLESEDILRLDFNPETITADGQPLKSTTDPQHDGYTWDKASRILRIRHEKARELDIRGRGGRLPPLLVTFDDPHLAAGTVLEGEYPRGVVDWGSGFWRMGQPTGKFGTFNLGGSGQLGFRFPSAHIFAGIDVFNPTGSEVTAQFRCGAANAVSIRLQPGELNRLRTGWEERCSQVAVDLPPGADLRFDNLAYLP